MELSDLIAYAWKKYHIREQHKWENFPGFTVLCHPDTGKWAALLMRQWDTDSGTEIQRCDLKCEREMLAVFHREYLSLPLRMHGEKWIGVAFGEETEEDVVFSLFDRAMLNAGEQRGFTVVLEEMPKPGGQVYGETELPVLNRFENLRQNLPPERIRQMRHLCENRVSGDENRAEVFYRQGMFMQEYEEEFPWKGEFQAYKPTYADLTTNQLRGYFSWRAKVRKGIYDKIPISAAYIYIYELLNGIGCSSPEDSLEKLAEFKTHYPGDRRMDQNLENWIKEFAILHLPGQDAQKYIPPEIIRRDRDLTILREPSAHSDEEVFAALCAFNGKSLMTSSAVIKFPEKGKHLFCETWRTGLAAYSRKGKDLFEKCFGEMVNHPWYPLGNAVYYWKEEPGNKRYAVNDCRCCFCENGQWKIAYYERLNFDSRTFRGLLKEADMKLRKYLKTGGYLHMKEEDAEAAKIVDEVIEADRRAAEEAERQNITIDLSGLEQIRNEAIVTRNSLLTEEERAELKEMESAEEVKEQEEPAPPRDSAPGLLDSVQIRILRALLEGGSAEKIMKENHLMPSMAADGINEALFDEIGDTAVSCEEDRLMLIEDYREELEQLLGGEHR